MSKRRIILACCGGLVFFCFLGALNWTFNRDWKRVVENLQAQIRALENDLLAVDQEQAALAGAIQKAASTFLEFQEMCEARMAREADERRQAVWGSYQKGATLNRHDVLKIGSQLNALRGVTTDLRGVGVATLTAVQGVIHQSHENLTGSSSPAETRLEAQERLKRLDAAISVAIQFITELKNKIAETESSLKEQQARVAELIPKGTATGDGVSQEGVKAVETTLKGIQLAQDFLERLDKLATNVAKDIFSIQSIAKAQRDFLSVVQ